MSSRSATASVHVAGIAGITAAGSRLEISSEDRPILLLVEPGQFKDVDAIIPSHQKIVSIGVLDELSSKGPNATRYLRLLDATAITSGQIVVLRPERLRFPSAFQSMVWPCSAMDILQVPTYVFHDVVITVECSVQISVSSVRAKQGVHKRLDIKL